MTYARTFTRLLRQPVFHAPLATAITRHASTSSSSNVPPAVDTFTRTNTPAPNNGPTALQKHVMFFDRNGDGKITLSETFQSLSLLGFGSVRSSALALAINGGLGRVTGAPWYAPLTINIDQIHKGKHGSDTDIYDANGNFSQPKFDELFSKYDTNQDGALSEKEFENFFSRKFEDNTSSLASKFEFGLLLEIAGEERTVDGTSSKVLTRETMSKFYDGTLLFDLVGETTPF